MILPVTQGVEVVRSMPSIIEAMSVALQSHFVSRLSVGISDEE